ncbi:MAG: hypothetical protein ACYDDF_01655 [Thermoplasmatota archaeon]
MEAEDSQYSERGKTAYMGKESSRVGSPFARQEISSLMDFEEPSEAWVLRVQTRLHQWAKEHPNEALYDLWGLVTHPMVLAEAWRRLAGNQGSRTAGVDGITKYNVEERGVAAFVEETHVLLRSGQFRAQPVRQHAIPKPDGRPRYLGIPTLRDRLVQMALKLVLEPLFEADFQPCPYGFRPNRSTHDAIQEIRH